MSPHRDKGTEHAHECAAYDAPRKIISRLKNIVWMKYSFTYPVCYPDEDQGEQATKDSFHQPSRWLREGGYERMSVAADQLMITISPSRRAEDPSSGSWRR